MQKDRGDRPFTKVAGSLRCTGDGPCILSLPTSLLAYLGSHKQATDKPEYSPTFCCLSANSCKIPQALISVLGGMLQ